ncbi:MAG: hypothetical protein ACFCVE_03880 [Phycisphaerae bacterium]
MRLRCKTVFTFAAGMAGGAVLLAGLGAAVAEGPGLLLPFEEAERTVSSDEVPEPALAVLRSFAGDARITGFELELRGGEAHYVAEWLAADGRASEATVTADGSLVEAEIDIPAEQVPEAVRRAAGVEAGDAQITYSLRTFTTYEAKFGPEGGQTELTLWPTGRLLYVERDQPEE